MLVLNTKDENGKPREQNNESYKIVRLVVRRPALEYAQEIAKRKAGTRTGIFEIEDNIDVVKI